MRRALAVPLLALAVTAAARSARAGGGAAVDAYDGIAQRPIVDLHGMVDLYSQWRVDARAPGVAAYRAFDVNADGPSLGFARVTIARKPETFGFRIDAGVGDAANNYFRTDPGQYEHRDLARGLSYVAQAFVSARVPLGRGLDVDVGKFATPIGLEDNEALVTWSYSRSLLFTLAEPTYHSGMRATYSFADSFAMSAFWLNGWDTNVVAGNGMRAFALGASWAPTDRTDVVLVYSAGLERAPTQLDDPTLSFRHVVSTSAVHALDDHVTFAATVDYGVDTRGDGATFWGVGGYARLSPKPWAALTLRGERYDDRDGFTTGTRQRLVEGTITLEARAPIGDAIAIGRLEYRRDQSDERVFVTARGASPTHQDTVTAAVIAAF